MRTKKSLILKGLILAFLLVLAVAIAGCPGNEEPAPKEEAKQDQQQDNKPKADIDISALIADWDKSGHSKSIASPAGREGCVTCHDGWAFSNQVTDPAKIPDGKKFVTGGEEGNGENAQVSTGTNGINCVACHTGQGTDLMKAGQVDVPAKAGLQAGKSALCVACHNPRKKADVNSEEKVYPHYGPQSDVVFGIGGMRTEGMNIGDHPHGKIDNPCITCHMSTNDKGQMTHTFAVTDQTVTKTCGDCHQDAKAINQKAKGDYDGDGNTEGLQDEVSGLLDLVMNTIVKDKLNGGKIDHEHGTFIFKDAAGAEIKVPNEVYVAAWNHALIDYDGSRGIHNPTFAVQILQQSYKVLTGKDVPNAKIK